jgi:hypothetical protein
MRSSCRIRTCNQIPTLPRLPLPWPLTVGGRRLPPDLAENAMRFPGARSLQGPPSTPMRLSCRIRTCNQIPTLPSTVTFMVTVCAPYVIPSAAQRSRGIFGCKAANWSGRVLTHSRIPRLRGLHLPGCGRKLPPDLAENALRFPGARSPSLGMTVQAVTIHAAIFDVLAPAPCQNGGGTLQSNASLSQLKRS